MAKNSPPPLQLRSIFPKKNRVKKTYPRERNSALTRTTVYKTALKSTDGERERKKKIECNCPKHLL